MNKSEISFILGSVVMSISGFTHNLFVDIFRDFGVMFSNSSFQNSMDQVIVNIFGGEMTVLSAFNGYSLSFGILTGFLGLFNLIIFRADSRFIFNHKEIILFDIVVTTILLIVSIIYLFYIPILAMISVLILFILAYFIKN